jgi:hypothetical protein
MSVPYALFSANGTPGATGLTGATGATAIIGLINLTYNLFRYEQVMRLNILT